MNQTLGQAQGNTKQARLLLRVAGFVDASVLVTSLCFMFSAPVSTFWFLVVLALVNVPLVWYAVSQGVVFEWFVERTFKEVCAGLGFNGEAISWKYGLIGALRGDRKIVQPNLRCVRGNGQAWTGIISQFPGQTVETYQAEAESYALAFNVPFCSFERTPMGDIRIRCGPVQVPEAYEYTPLPRWSNVRQTLQALPMAEDRAGNTWYMPIEEQHVLVAGRTGSGKNSYGWGLVFGLEEAILAGVVRIYAIDPKRIELSYGKHWFYKYANTPETMVDMVEEFMHEMQARTDMMEGVSRKFTPSPETPLNILFIDELAYLTALLPDKKLRDKGMAALTTILTQGRAIGYSVFSMIQDPRKEVLPNRDLFTIRIALGLPEKSLIDMVLGEHAYEKGAYCDQLPLGDEGAGTGYVMTPDRREPLLVRAAWCSDVAVRRKLGAPADAVLETPPLDYPAYEQGYPLQLGFDSQPLDQ
jgi:DNA segregation ATPase FtsK/SpoIIIE, S-DNA-T family